jgi:hypothetical protein
MCSRVREEEESIGSHRKSDDAIDDEAIQATKSAQASSEEYTY